MRSDVAKRILEKEITSIGDKDLTEALYTILDDFVSKRKLKNHISKELHLIKNNKALDKNILNGIKSAYIAVENIFLKGE